MISLVYKLMQQVIVLLDLADKGADKSLSPTILLGHICHLLFTYDYIVNHAYLIIQCEVSPVLLLCQVELLVYIWFLRLLKVTIMHPSC